jgi:hypothetical protein
VIKAEARLKRAKRKLASIDGGRKQRAKAKLALRRARARARAQASTSEVACDLTY